MDERPTTPSWHSVSLRDVLAALDTSADGLSLAEGERRLRATGANLLPRTPRASHWRVLGAQLASVIVLLLVVAAGISVVMGDPIDAAAIALVLVLNVGLGYTMEIGAHRAVEALTSLEVRRATVLRDGALREVDGAAVVPGDIVALEAGDAVPADGRIVSASELRVVESTLTGESLPVSKADDLRVEEEAALPDRRNMVYAGTTVVAGTARAVVVATGATTELGHIGLLVGTTTAERTPLERRLDALGRQLLWLALGVAAVTGALGWWRGDGVGQVVQGAIALAVAAVPEGLPAVATIALALGVRRMARRRAIVRRLPSVEALGSVTVVCTDKTGTLTAGAMQVTSLRAAGRVIRVEGRGYEPERTFRREQRVIAPQDDPDLMMLLRVLALANRADAVWSEGAWTPRGDPTEAALTVAARGAGIERADVIRELPEIGEVPFSSGRAFMATFHRAHDGLFAFVKGSPPVVVGMCGRMTEEDRRAVNDANRSMAADGLRVLAAAYGPVTTDGEAALRDLTFAGLAGLSDPPAEGVRETVRMFHNAGIRTVMITGDQPGTAVAIARLVGLPADPSSVIQGSAIDSLTDDQLYARVADASLFARVSPEAKLRIVTNLQRRGEIVAMLGDGVNDAVALKKADVGVTMGRRGTAVAREAATVVLADDRFETIAAAIEEGRVAFDNIRKFVFYLFSCNLAEIVVLLGAAAAGLASPLLPIHILWLNLVTDTLPALALAAEPADSALMRRPPRSPQSDLVSPAFARQVAAYAALIAFPAFAAMWWAGHRGVPHAHAMSLVFMVLSLAQLLHLGNSRGTRDVLHPRRALANVAALVAVAAGIGIQAATVLWAPLRAFLRLTEFTAEDWTVVVILSLIPALVGQSAKLASGTSGQPARGRRRRWRRTASRLPD